MTESVYCHQLRPVLLTGAVAMDQIFAEVPTSDDSLSGKGGIGIHRTREDADAASSGWR